MHNSHLNAKSLSSKLISEFVIFSAELFEHAGLTVVLKLTQSLKSTVNKQRIVKMLWCDKYGSNSNCIGRTRSSVPAANLSESNLSPLTAAQGYSFITYNFVVPIDASASISKFWFQVDERNGTKPSIYNNGGNGYVVQQDQLLFVPTLSQMTLQSNTASITRRGGGSPVSLVKEYFIVAAVRCYPRFYPAYVFLKYILAGPRWYPAVARIHGRLRLCLHQFHQVPQHHRRPAT